MPLDGFASQSRLDIGRDDAALASSAQKYATIDQDNWLDYTKDRAASGDEAAIDTLTDFYASETSAKTAREYETEQNAHIVDTLVEQYKRNGLNPYWLLDSGSVGSVSYTANSNKYSSSGYMSRRKQKEKVNQDIATDIIKVAGLVSSAIMMAFMLA